MATQVRSAALNLYRKNSLEDQKADLLKAMANADIVALSELHGSALLTWARRQGFGVVPSRGDTAIIYDARRFDVERKGSKTLNQTEGPTGGMRSREAAWATLRDKTTGETFSAIAAHTTPPHQGSKKMRQKIRQEQYQALSELANQLHGEAGDRSPVILAGDLNFKNPSIEGMNNATQGGVMHTLATGLNIVDVDRTGTRGDHAMVTTTYTTGPGKKGVSLGDRGVTRAGKKTKMGALRDGEGDKLSSAELQAEYGFGYNFFRSDPDLWKLLQDAISEGYSPEQFVAHMRELPWFKEHSATWRENMGLKFTDPATFHENVQNKRDEIENLAGTWGVQLTDKQTAMYAERALLLGWSPEQILDHIAKDVRPGKDGGYDGQLASVEERLRNTALNNGVKLNAKQLNGWMKRIVRGDADPAEFDSYVRRMAVQTFGAYGKEIKAGVDLADIAAPYMNSMAEILELNPEEVNLFDKTIRQAMTNRNEKGEFVPMSMTDFEDSLRADRRWQYTDDAKEQLTGYAVELGRMFGVI